MNVQEQLTKMNSMEIICLKLNRFWIRFPALFSTLYNMSRRGRQPVTVSIHLCFYSELIHPVWPMRQCKELTECKVHPILKSRRRGSKWQWIEPRFTYLKGHSVARDLLAKCWLLTVRDGIHFTVCLKSSCGLPCLLCLGVSLSLIPQHLS